MVRARYKLVQLNCESFGASDEVPTCEQIQLIARLEAPDGSSVERAGTFLAYEGIMHDANQFPWILAECLRCLMLGTHHSAVGGVGIRGTSET